MNIKAFIAENDGALLLLFMGVLFGVIGFLLILKQIRLKRTCVVETIGVFDHFNSKIEVNSKNGSRPTRTYYAVYRYQYHGEDYYVRSAHGSSRQYNFKENVTVMLNPDNPRERYVREQKGMMFLPSLFLIFGIGMTGFAIWGIIQTVIH